MTDNADLIAEARQRSPEGSLALDLADALEAAERRAAQAEAELKDAYRTDIPSLKDQRDAAIKRAEDAERGLYDVYDALGFDKDGARTPRELFGPMTNGTPAEIVIEAAKEFREDSEREADEAEQRVAEYAAVVEKVLSHDPLHGADSGLHCGGMAPCIRDILATAPADALREVKAEAIREYVTAARENPHTYYWPPSGVLDDAEQWADEIEKGTF